MSAQSILRNNPHLKRVVVANISQQPIINSTNTYNTYPHTNLYDSHRGSSVNSVVLVKTGWKYWKSALTKTCVMKLLMNRNSRSLLAWLTSSTLFRVAEKTNKEELPTAEVWVNVCSQRLLLTSQIKKTTANCATRLSLRHPIIKDSLHI